MRNHVRFRSALLALTIGLALGGDVRASFVVTMTQVGGDVVAKGSGSLNTTGLTLTTQAFIGAEIAPQNAIIIIGGAGGGVFTAMNIYSGAISGPASLGGGGMTFASTSSGDLAGIANSVGIYVPASYTSGAALTSSSTWTGATFAGLGVTAGTYTWTWGSGATADSFTLVVGGPAAVPEPASLAMLGLGGIAILGCVRRCRTKACSTAC